MWYLQLAVMLYDNIQLKDVLIVQLHTSMGNIFLDKWVNICP